MAIAFALALRKHKTEVVLADFKEVTPHVHKYFGIDLREKSDIYEAMENRQEVIEVVKRHLYKKQGIWIFPGVGLEDFTKFEEKHFSAIIEVLKKEFDHVVIDTSPGIFFSSTYASLKNSDLIYAVLLSNRWSLEDTAMMIDFICNRWNVRKNRFKALLNMAGHGEIDQHTVERILEIEAFSVRYGQKYIISDADRIVKAAFLDNDKAEGSSSPIRATERVKSLGAN
nr:ParA family protein [Thermosediminibacter litoriperuensis]